MADMNAVQQSVADGKRTFRMVAETEHGLCAIDVILRGRPVAIAEVSPKVTAWLDIGIESAGAWVDPGTDRLEG